ncbi:pentatricopeptide repeat-containing protein At2g38420, mitochondrial [Cucurbita maxima]|uniref:Pentatricopeptide repeat-containing protein At2g38420, mitochondrial n=1 Tax=Cucurbita maxima TaxID=3661 RepID=A0A6J1IZC4_CUCMA|nr:pentatricopeptide repeat-containing protein At2g38420, mitochondrial [Cucurbita maxima]XP_022983451.1 pentatricopeptide repeat-containing protein At2g38420, mitochondrial [Cucurbita maxima]XP_022983452.1 pentatricopeptide repeat-containing protein At2g38420, mitochondrial [Cucurbita maxima]XP_022983453.1 pentatricopeptide repeat-containing protein At2g38420, mitochondrial [Cucurbita maxima]XP_022983454.1 pentatricopeptide repeat-containing protein At2g38420, mitochondrial [Cucurbita maxima]
MESIRVVKRSDHFLRKHRKWPFSPFKTKWHQTFNQDEALRAIKQAANSPKQPNSDEPYLLSVLISSFRAYCCDPTPNAYHFVLKTLARSSQFHYIAAVLDRLERVEKFETPESIFVDLLKVYGRVNRIQDAITLFRRIPMFRCVPSALSLNSLLFLLCRNGEGLRIVPEIILSSQTMGIRLEESTFRILITALCKIYKVGHAMELFNYMITEGYGLNPGICSLILASLCEHKKSTGNVVLIFLEQMRLKGFCPLVVDYSNVIKFLVRRGLSSDALDLLNKMKADGFKPDIVCYTMVLNGVIADGDYKMADELFDELLLFGLVPDIYTYNVYIHGLCKQGNWEAGIQMILHMEELGCKPDVITYNILLECLCKIGELDEARKLRGNMQLKGLANNVRTFRIMISGLFHNGDVIEACILLEEMLVSRFPPQISTFGEILSWLCKRDMVGKALELLTLMVGMNFSPGPKAWETLLLSSESELTPVKSLETTLEDLGGI